MTMYTKYSFNFQDDWLCHRAGAFDISALLKSVCGSFSVISFIHRYFFVEPMPVQPHRILVRQPLTFSKRRANFAFQNMWNLKNMQHLSVFTHFPFFGLHYLCYTAVSADYLRKVKVTSNNAVDLWNGLKYLNYDDDFGFAKYIQPCRY